jgi:hypothetical protein
MIRYGIGTQGGLEKETKTHMLRTRLENQQQLTSNRDAACSGQSGKAGLSMVPYGTLQHHR